MSKEEKKSTSGRKQKHEKKNRSSTDEDQRAKEIGKRRKKKWYSSNDHSSENDNDRNKKKGRSGKTKKKKKKSRKHYTSDDDDDDDRLCKGSIRKPGSASVLSGDQRGRRKEMGLDWMLRPTEPTKATTMKAEDQASIEAVKKPNPREVNPYFKNDGSGYPGEADESRIHLQESLVVGDGGASWRRKALKRAQEQAAQQGRKLNEVVEERWGSVGQLVVSAASRSAAPSRAHLHAIRTRQKDVDKKSGNNTGRDYLRDVSVRHHDMKAPIVHHDNLSWKKRTMPCEEERVISAAMATLNQFSNDGTFLHQFQNQNEKDDGSDNSKPELVSSESNIASEEIPLVKEGLSANQLAAKAMQLRMKGKHEEAETLMQEAERMKLKQQSSIRPRNEGSATRLFMKDMPSRIKKGEDGATEKKCKGRRGRQGKNKAAMN